MGALKKIFSMLNDVINGDIKMQKLIIAAIAALAFSSVAFAADTMNTTTSGASSTKKMSPTECADAMKACKDDTCRNNLVTINGCQAQPQPNS